MRGVHLFIFIIAFPFLISLGHDAYLFYQEHGANSIVQDIEKVREEKGDLSFFASIGFAWTKHSPESYGWVVNNLDEETWSKINNMLPFKATFVTGLFTAVIYAILLILKLFRLWPFNVQTATSFTGSNRVDEMLSGKSVKKKTKYKRK